MNRRSFFGAILGFVATPTLVGGDNTIGVFSWLWNKLFPRKATQEEKERLIAEAFETKEGRHQLAQAMVEPLRRQLDYQSLARKVLCVEELPQGGNVPWIETPTIKIDSVATRRFYLVDRELIKPRHL